MKSPISARHPRDCGTAAASQNKDPASAAQTQPPRPSGGRSRGRGSPSAG